jgi:hypothetical protein
LHLAVRELDMTTRELGPGVYREAYSRRELAGDVLDALVSAFTPLVELERAKGNAIAGKLRAAALVDDEASPLVVAPGDPLAVVLRIDDRLGRTTSDQVYPLPLTVLSVSSRDGADITCEIHAATRHRLGARASFRLSRYALAVRPPRGPTRVVLQTPGDAGRPLPDYELVEEGAKGEGVRVVARSDAFGRAEIAAGDRPWRLLYVRHGEHLLARLPIITGRERELVVPLASNDVRLRAEGFVAALEQEVVDTVARRQILTARLRQKIAAKDYDAAQAVLEQLQGLTSSRDFNERLQAARAKYVGDSARSQQHIDDLFLTTRESLTRYLDPQEIERLQTQLAQARRQR